MKNSQSIQISIPNPCHEDWNKMTPQEQGRFCASCRKCVVDFTGFNDEQLYKFIDAHKGQKICGRFRGTQLNRQINIPHQPHSTLYKWMIAAGLALIFVASPEMKGFAQAPLTVLTTGKGNNQIQDSTSKRTGFSVSGVVLDDNNEPLIYATVELILDGIIKGGSNTDIDGFFEIKNIQAGKYAIVVKSLGYNNHSQQLSINGSVNNIKLKLNADDRAVLGDMVIMVEYKIPLINKFEGGNTRTITSDEIEKGAY